MSQTPMTLPHDQPAGAMARYMALLAAFLGWLFDGVEIGLYPLISKPAIQELVGGPDVLAANPHLYETNHVWVVAAFLIGAACGGALFGWLGRGSYFCGPLVGAGKAVGIFTFAPAESGRRYTNTDLVLATNLANRASVAIENAELYQALRESDRRKDEFLATLAHELRNPLAPISNSLQILKMSRSDAATLDRSLKMMERQVHVLVRLVNDLLDVSRIRGDKITVRRERIDVATLVNRARATVRPSVLPLRFPRGLAEAPTFRCVQGRHLARRGS